MTNLLSTTIEILGKPYPVRCPEAEVESLQQAASLLNQKMQEIRESGKAINLERIAIITALNLAHQLLQQNKDTESLMNKINQRISQLHNQLDTAVNQTLQTEFIYSAEEDNT